jgi:hypothetical protein
MPPRPLLIISSSSMHCASRPLYLVLRATKRGELLAYVPCFYRKQSLFLVSASHVYVVGKCVGGWLLMRMEELPTSMLCHLRSGHDTRIHMICRHGRGRNGGDEERFFVLAARAGLHSCASPWSLCVPLLQSCWLAVGFSWHPTICFWHWSLGTYHEVEG